MNETQEAAVLEAALDGLGADPTAEQIIQTIEGFSDLAIAAALKRTGGGGGGGGIVSCVLAREAAMNIRTANTYPILWDTLYDNAWDQNTLGSIPEGLGLSFVFDGSSAAIETTEAGTWIFTASVYRAGVAGAWEGSFDLGVARAADLMGHTVAARSMVEQTLTIPPGASFSPQITVDVGSATNPYEAFVLMPITRIA